jgi:hypothetical protein
MAVKNLFELIGLSAYSTSQNGRNVDAGVTKGRYVVHRMGWVRDDRHLADP